MSHEPSILAAGPWETDQVEARWIEDQYDPGSELSARADEKIAALRDRGSPSHDGVSARLTGHSVQEGRLVLHLQPIRWSLRLVDGDASDSVAAMCVARDHEGRWLAGRRAPWLASWAGRWGLGAGGAVDPFESPVHTLGRELEEEWGVQPTRMRVETLVRLPHRLVILIGQAWLAEGAEIVPDDEHDAWAWWPADPQEWPAEADDGLRRLAYSLR